MTTPSYKSVNPELLEEVIAQAKARLQVQLTVGLAADQRAMTFAGLLFAGVAVLVGLSLGHSGESAPNPDLLGVAAGFVFAAGFACWSARPVSWHFTGNLPSAWEEDIAKQLPLAATRAETASGFERRLEENEASLQSAAELMRISLVIALLSAMTGVVRIAT